MFIDFFKKLFTKEKPQNLSLDEFDLSKLSLKAFKSFVYHWNNNYPVDRWWREKHKIPFNSLQHREFCFIDMFFEYQEDKIFAEIMSKREEKKDEDIYKPGYGDYLKKKKLTEKEIDEAFDNLDISKLKIPGING